MTSKLPLRLGIVAVLLIGFLLAVWDLSAAPPGLTHDEANHATEAFEVLSGEYRAYFPLGYGREPLYAYLLAGAMGLIRPNEFVMRLMVPWFMLFGLSAMYVWVRKAFNRPTALLTTLLIGVSYWPIVVNHQALRSGLIPFFMTVFVASGWMIWRSEKNSWLWSVIGGLSLAAMLYTYIAARVLWLVLPAFAIYLLVFHFKNGKRSAWPMLLAAGIGWLAAIPLFVYLANNPGLETRLEMLDGPIAALREGNIVPLARNVGRALLGLVWPGSGDQFIAYNIPGRPTLNPISAVLAVIGLGISIWRWQRPTYALLLIWLVVGLSPSLITGPTANTTRNIGALPVLYLLPVIGLMWLMSFIPAQQKPRVQWSAAAGWLGITLLLSATTFFDTWRNSADVRAAYQTTMIAQLEQIDDIIIPEQPVVISSVYPGPAHDPSIAQLVFEGEYRPLRWIDARRSLIFPVEAEAQGEIILLAPASADLHPHFAEWVTVENRTEMRPSDLDPYYRQLAIQKPQISQAPIANFDNAVLLLSAEWLGESVPPNGVGELLTVWRVADPTLVGPTHLPTETTDINLFVHVLREDGTILTQEDLLAAPSWDWREGDLIFHIHQVYVGPDTAPGEYAAVVGIYDRPSGARLTDRISEESFAPATPLVIESP